MAKTKQVFVFKKGEMVTLDTFYVPMQVITTGTRKPESREELERLGGIYVGASDICDRSEYEVITKNIKITIEITD